MDVSILRSLTSQHPEELRAAEERVKSLETQPNFHFALLQALDENVHDPQVRWMAAILFKNGVGKFWRKTVKVSMSKEEKDAIRSVVLSVAFKEPLPNIRAQLAVAVGKIARIDFPTEW